MVILWKYTANLGLYAKTYKNNSYFYILIQIKKEGVQWII